jgi:methionine sulfoxide reductase heme-binding subunit
MSSYWLKRTQRVFLLCAIAALITISVFAAIPPPDFRHRLSMGTAYGSLFFLAATLGLGPWNVLRRRKPPVSYDLRRDIGIVAGVLALIHTGVGLTVHLRGRMWMYFFKKLHPLRIQANAFGAANYLGLIAAILFVMLIAISNDISLRSLGTPQWKNLQRWTYPAFGLTIAHGILFQAVEKRHLSWVILFASIAITTVLAQTIGFMRRRQQQRAVFANAMAADYRTAHDPGKSPR